MCHRLSGNMPVTSVAVQDSGSSWIMEFRIGAQARRAGVIPQQARPRNFCLRWIQTLTATSPAPASPSSYDTVSLLSFARPLRRDITITVLHRNSHAQKHGPLKRVERRCPGRRDGRLCRPLMSSGARVAWHSTALQRACLAKATTLLHGFSALSEGNGPVCLLVALLEATA